MGKLGSLGSVLGGTGVPGNIGQSIQSAQNVSSFADTLGAFGSLFSGFGQSSALLQQAGIATEEAEATRRRRKREIAQFAAQQESRFLSSGVTLAGTPLLVLEETRRLGAEELDAITRRGEALSSLFGTQASQARSRGFAGFGGGLFSATAGQARTRTAGQQIGLFGTPSSPSRRATRQIGRGSGF